MIPAAHKHTYHINMVAHTEPAHACLRACACARASVGVVARASVDEWVVGGCCVRACVCACVEARGPGGVEAWR